MKRNKNRPVRPPSVSARRRIFILDDHPVMRYGLTQLLNQEPDLKVCGEAEGARQALSALKPPLPDLVLADVGLPGQSIIEFLKNLRALHPGLPVLILSTYDENIFAERVVRAGARGYVMKSEGGTTLLQAIRTVLSGKPHLSAAMAARAFEIFGGRRRPMGEAVLDKLTDREFEVFQWLGEGMTNREVAKQLCISPKTVETHRLSLCQKLNIKTPAQLIRHAVEFLQHGMWPR